MPTPVVPANFSAVRARSYVYRLPLFTRLLLFLIVAAWIATVALGDDFDVKAWGALVPEEVGITNCMSPSLLPRLGWVEGRGPVLVPRNIKNADKSAPAVYRTNTYTFIHINLLHMLMNVLALTPMLERFESEYGTLTSLALFFGREYFLCPIPRRRRHTAIVIG